MTHHTGHRAVMVVGPFPPPLNGQSVATEVTARELERAGISVTRINLASIDRTGRSGLVTWKRTREVLSHATAFVVKLMFRNQPTGVYLTVAQTRAGFVRDALLVFAARALGCHVVAHVHGGRLGVLYADAPRPIKRWMRLVYRLVERVIVLSEGSRRMVEEFIDLDKVDAIVNPVENELVLSEEALQIKLEEMKRNASCLKLLYLSNLIPSKGYRDVIEAVRILVEAGRPVQCTFAGAFVSEEDEASTRELIHVQGLDAYITFAGVVSGQGKKDLLWSSDVYLLPTYYENEGLPISMLEAMGAGLALVVTNHRAIGEVVRDNENGIIVPPRDPESIAKAIRRLENISERSEIAATNVQAARDCYSTESYMKNILATCSTAYGWLAR